MRWVGTGPIYLGLQQKCFSVCPSMVQCHSYFILNSIFTFNIIMHYCTMENKELELEQCVFFYIL